MRMTPVKLLKKLYFWSTGYSYTNLGRLFLRLFVGIMLLQFGIRQIGHFHDICDRGGMLHIHNVWFHHKAHDCATIRRDGHSGIPYPS